MTERLDGSQIGGLFDLIQVRTIHVQQKPAGMSLLAFVASNHFLASHSNERPSVCGACCLMSRSHVLEVQDGIHANEGKHSRLGHESLAWLWSVNFESPLPLRLAVQRERTAL